MSSFAYLEAIAFSEECIEKLVHAVLLDFAVLPYNLKVYECLAISDYKHDNIAAARTETVACSNYKNVNLHHHKQ